MPPVVPQTNISKVVNESLPHVSQGHLPFTYLSRLYGLPTWRWNMSVCSDIKLVYLRSIIMCAILGHNLCAIILCVVIWQLFVSYHDMSYQIRPTARRS